MQSVPLLDCAGRRRSPATLASFHEGHPPRNKGLRYPPDPPTVEEIIAVMRAAGDDPDGVRLRGLIVVLWRAGLRISEVLALSETDLDPDRGAILVRRGKGGKRREVGMDRWAWDQLQPWLAVRASLPVGALFCVLRGPTRGSTVRARRCACAAAPDRAGCRRTTPVRTPPAPARPRCRDVSRGRPACRHSATARTCRPRDHLGVPAGDRQHRDHPRRPRAADADDPGHLRPQTEALKHHTAGGSAAGVTGVEERSLDRAPPRQLTRSVTSPFRSSGTRASILEGIVARCAVSALCRSLSADCAKLVVHARQDSPAASLAWSCQHWARFQRGPGGSSSPRPGTGAVALTGCFRITLVAIACTASAAS